MSSEDRNKLKAEIRDELLAALDPVLSAILDRILPPKEEHTPEETAPSGVSAPVMNSTGSEWKQGVSLLVSRFVLRDTPEAKAAFVKGAAVEFANGEQRYIAGVTAAHDNLYVEYSGGKLDPKSVGHPNVVIARKEPAAEDSKPSPTPEQPKPGKPEVRRPGLICANVGLGQGAEQVVPGTHMQHYRWPQLAEYEKARASGFRRARVGGLWERMKLGGAGKGKGRLNNEEMDRILQSVEFAKRADMKVLLDLHNYSGYSTGSSASNSVRKKIGSPEVPIEALGDDWRLFLEYLCKDATFRETIYGYDIMNEPIIPWATWKPAAQHAINQIAAVSDGVVVIEGINYSNTTYWVTNNPGMETLTHPKGKEFLEFQGHLYLDKGQDGFWTQPDEVSGVVDVNVGLERIAKFAAWGKQHGLKLGIGETMVPGIYPQYVAALDKMLAYCVEQGIDVYVFFTAHGAGSNWHNIYKPENAPTLKVIEKYAKAQ